MKMEYPPLSRFEEGDPPHRCDGKEVAVPPDSGPLKKCIKFSGPETGAISH